MFHCRRMRLAGTEMRSGAAEGFASSKSKAGAVSPIQLEGPDCTVWDLGRGVSESEAAPGN